MESSVSNFSGDDSIAELGAEAGWEDFATCCKLSSTEIFAMQLHVRTAAESTNMMMTGNQFGAQLPRGPKGTLIKNDAVTLMTLFKRANRTCAPNMRRERMSQNPWNLAFLRIPDKSE